MTQHPRPGRAVMYALSEFDVTQIALRRETTDQNHHQRHMHALTTPQPGDRLPMFITRIHGDGPDGCVVNGQVLLDGDDSLWVTSVSPGRGPGQFLWSNVE